MKEKIIKTTKEDIIHILNEIDSICKKECSKDIILLRDFKSCRSMVDTLIKTYDNLNRMYECNIFKRDGVFVEYFLTSLFVESDRIHKIMEDSKGYHDQYRCLNDAYIRLTDKIRKIENEKTYYEKSHSLINNI